MKTLKEGDGATPTADDTVKVNYRGTLLDGTEFDSSYKRNEPATFPLKNVIPCWTNGVAMMKAGGKAKLVCPSEVAYGDQGHPPTIPGGSTLIFEVELLGDRREARGPEGRRAGQDRRQEEVKAGPLGAHAPAHEAVVRHDEQARFPREGLALGVRDAVLQPHGLRLRGDGLQDRRQRTSSGRRNTATTSTGNGTAATLG